MHKKKTIPAVLFQRNLNLPGPVNKPRRLELFEEDLARVSGSLKPIITYDAPGVPGDVIDG
ncbi:MAG TPA: hypothetical protein VFT22_07965 [Kofleriaceae bacterium]|nr:hypothetical protein [Kofleriaceae bacterium]